MKKIYLIFSFLLHSSIVSSQNYIDLAKYDYAISSLNTFDSSKATTILREQNGNITLPLVINDSFAFLTGVSYESFSASFDPNRNSESVNSIILKIGANIKHNSNWSGTYMFLPQISSDLKNISKRDYQFGGVILMKYIKTSNFNYRFGLYGNSERFSAFFVPIFGFYYLSPSKKIEANVLLPLSVDLNYSIALNFRLGLNFKGQVKSYNINTPIGSETDRYLTKSAKDLYTYFQYGIKNGLNFQFGLGRSIGRTYEIYKEKVSFGLPLIYFGDDRTQLNTSFSDSWLFKVAIIYRLKLGDSKN